MVSNFDKEQNREIKEHKDNLKTQLISLKKRKPSLYNKVLAFIKAGEKNVWLNRSADMDDGSMVNEQWLDVNSFRVVTKILDLVHNLKQSNQGINQGYIFNDFAFINQVNGGDEWAIFKYDRKTKTAFQFESYSCASVINRDKREFIKDVNKMMKATNEKLRRAEY